MQLLKPLFVIATAGFVAACTAAPNGSEGFPAIGGPSVSNASGVDASVVSPSLVGRLDAASKNGDVIAYAYFLDVVKETPVINGADVYCGGNGSASLNGEGLGLERTTKGGRDYNIMRFICL